MPTPCPGTTRAGACSPLPITNATPRRRDTLIERVVRERARFIEDYDDYVDQARLDLGRLFRLEDYPDTEALQGKFAIRYRIVPVPDARHFMADLAQGETERVRRDIESQVRTRLNDAQRDLYRRLGEAVERVGERLREDENGKPLVFRDSLIENIRELVDVVPRLNIFADDDLAMLCREVKDKFAGIEPDALRPSGRFDPNLRRQVMRDLAAEGYRTETGDTWRPRNGSHSSQTGKLTSAAIDARDYLRARKDRETSAHLPEGTLVAFTGGKDFGDVTAIWHSLDSIKLKYDDMVLLHGGGPGAEKIAASWAEKNGVHQVVCKPNWDRDGKAAPFRRNDVLLNFLPKGLVAFPGSGITNNMIDKARKIGIPVLLAAA